MDNGSLNTNGIRTQREATMQRDGGWRKGNHYHKICCIILVEKNPVFCSQIDAASC